MAINLTEKTSPRVLNTFSKGSVTEGLFNSEYDSEFIGAETVKIYTLETPTENDYTRSGQNRYGQAEDIGDTVQELKVTQDKSTTFTIDKGNNVQQMFIKKANELLAKFVRTVMTPNIDKYRLGVVGAAVPVGNVITLASGDSIYEAIVEATEKQDDFDTPEAGRVMWATNEAIKMLKLDPNFVLASDLGQAVKYNGQVGEVDGYAVIRVNKNRMPANTLALIAHVASLVSPIQLSDFTIHENAPGVNGHLVEARYIYDAFVLEGLEGALVAIKKA